MIKMSILIVKLIMKLLMITMILIIKEVVKHKTERYFVSVENSVILLIKYLLDWQYEHNQIKQEFGANKTKQRNKILKHKLKDK